MTKANSTKNTTNNNSNTTDALNLNGNMVRFVDSSSIPGANGAVIFTPEKWNGLVWDSGDTFSCINAFNAIRDFLAGTYQKAGEYVHVFNPKSSRYDGMKTFYIGGNLAVAAITEGHKTMTIQVAEKTISLVLPSSVDNIGEWCQVKMRTDFWGRVVPATDTQHMMNIINKHFFLDKLLSGTKLNINTTPVVWSGALWMTGSNEARKLRSELFAEDGTAKSVEEMIKPYNDRKVEYQGTNTLDRQTATMMKVAPILGLTVASVIIVKDVDAKTEVAMNVTDVPHGRYQLLDAIGNVKNYSVIVNGTLDSENRLKTAATNKWDLVPLK